MDPGQTWAAVTDFEGHGQAMPLSHVLCEPRAPHSPTLGWRFIARTRLGPVTMDDPMRITRWNPPGTDGIALFRVDKVGPILGGWAVVLVRPDNGGTSVRWTQHVRPRLRLPPPGERVADWLTRWLYGRAIDDLLAKHAARR